jgi:hypothetical protein
MIKLAFADILYTNKDKILILHQLNDKMPMENNLYCLKKKK